MCKSNFYHVNYLINYKLIICNLFQIQIRNKNLGKVDLIEIMEVSTKEKLTVLIITRVHPAGEIKIGQKE